MGGCDCGRVRIEARGEPTRVGLCHCLNCRKETGAPFMAFAVWRQGQVSVAGDAASWTSTAYRRHFCPACGATMFATNAAEVDQEVEIRLGTLDDAPSGLLPEYELWTSRREHWLQPVPGAEQHLGDRR